MVFLHNDFYTASGSVNLYHSWTDKVTKFDTSSFYNWEQDNLPLYDLDERTYYLWEQLGHPTSSLPGVALVVSAGGDPSEYTYNRNNFETVSAAIEALPQVLNYPVIIEICNKGNLGELHLKNIKCGPRGSLEIVNKVFAKAEPIFNSSSLHEGTVYGGDDYNLIGSLSGLVSGSTYNISFTARKHFLDSKSEFLNKNIFDTTSLTSIDGALNGFVQTITEERNTRATYFTRSTGIGTNANVLSFTPFEKTTDATTNHLIDTYDISSYDTEGEGSFVPDIISEDSNLNSMIGLFYGNNLNKVVVTNCDGPIYLRNIFVDGSGYATGNKYGFSISNSRDVYLENCVSVKNTTAGFNLNNSKVIITRGIGAYRNYDFINNTRLTEPSDHSNIYRDIRDFAAGLLATNSEIQFSSTSSFERQLFQNDPVFSAVSSFGSLFYGFNYPINFSRNANGIVLINSKLYGGIAGASSTTITCELNNICGLQSLNSNVIWDGRLKTRQNNIGILSENSKLVLDKFTIRENTHIGLLLKNSNLIYNKNLTTPSLSEDQFKFDYNGKHLLLDNSVYNYIPTSNIPSKYGIHKFLNCNEKSIYCNNTSKLNLIHSYIRSRNDIVGNKVKYGDPVICQDNSLVTFKGSKQCATTIIGRTIVDVTDYSKNSAGVYSNNNSVVELQGPTIIAQYGIDALAENNSIINFNPHKNEETGELQIVEFNLSDAGNHTMVELHSTRSCLVANKKSIINLQDLGDFSSCWNRSSKGQELLSLTVDNEIYLENVEYVSGGFLQFYPNPMGSSVDIQVTELSSTVNAAFTPDTLGELPAPYYSFSRNDSFNEFSSITLGGLCVRAVANSVINVKNVNFPTGWWNASGIFYNATAEQDSNLCAKLFIWNIADDSQLHASYCSVSSLYPTEAGYHGPYAVWLSSLKDNGSLSGGLVTAADPYKGDAYTSSYALLDFAGSGPSTIDVYTSSFNNVGPFRLYFSTDPVVNLLGIVSAGEFSSLSVEYFESGWIPQVFAQGYYPPGYLSSISGASFDYKTLFRYYQSGSRVFTTSGLFRPTGQEVSSIYSFGAGVIQSPLSTRVFLDESAANIFANAKHCAAGKSGAPKIVSIYYSHKSLGGDSNFDNKGIGVGVPSLNSFDLSRDN